MQPRTGPLDRADLARVTGKPAAEVLAALVNGGLLVVFSIAIAIAAIGRFSDPPAIDGWGVLALGVFGLAGNLAATLVLARGQRGRVKLHELEPRDLRPDSGHKPAPDRPTAVVAGLVFLGIGGAWTTALLSIGATGVLAVRRMRAAQTSGVASPCSSRPWSDR